VRKRGIVDEVYSSSLTRAESNQLCSRRLCQGESFERGEVGERGRAVRHITAVTLLAQIPTRAPPNRDSMISGKGGWRLRVECL